MFSYLANRLLCFRKSLLHFILQMSDFFSHLGNFVIQRLSSSSGNPTDLEANVPCGIPEDSMCRIRTTNLQPQHELDLLGVGASGQVYNVSEQVVLKSCRTFVPPSSDAPEIEHWDYASDTLFHFNLMENERTVLQQLQKRPHPHIIEAIDTEQPEGLYLRKYRQIPDEVKTNPARRIRLYHDIADALRHLHSLGIVHDDVRIDNVLVDDRDSAILCDFSAASPCGDSNLVFPHLPLPIGGPSPILSEETDMFAFASFMFKMEVGSAPEFSFESGKVSLPELNSGNESIDKIIRTAWLGNYDHTSDVVQDLASMDSQVNNGPQSSDLLPTPEYLKRQVMDWRKCREDKFGMMILYTKLDDQNGTLPS
ncbi:hypothetical protein N7456_005043 [Penicillium angulare]|uniref:EKC/KEOPS complex subunit BUD32 n=1 Tax=Penicillium angulare TaxID=116970 RepID=A0A9W9FXP8_9EURO|nr:hypothetical protein N7456_005043 [Penicillium angulare]